MAKEKENPGGLAGAAGAERERHSAPKCVTSAGEGRFTGFKSLKWERNVLDVIIEVQGVQQIQRAVQLVHEVKGVTDVERG